MDCGWRRTGNFLFLMQYNNHIYGVCKMKSGIHPNYGPAKVICACGKTWEIMSTRKEQKVGICAECHPFITGKQKLVDVAGRVEKFRRRYEKKGA